jgi:hypothetical protein
MIDRLLKAEPAVLIGIVGALLEAAVLLGLLPPTAQARWATVAGPLATLLAALGIRQVVYSPATVARLRAKAAPTTYAPPRRRWEQDPGPPPAR